MGDFMQAAESDICAIRMDGCMRWSHCDSAGDQRGRPRCPPLGIGNGRYPFTVHGFGRVGASLNHPAWALSGGVILGWRSLEGELGVEWNPFISIDRVGMDAGTFNVYLAGSWRWQVSPKVDITTGLGIGASVLLFETVGTPVGSVGPYVLVRPLGVTRHLGRRLALAVNAFEVSAPIPQIRGWPLAVIQYRASVSLRF
jgi:hypothetical protein